MSYNIRYANLLCITVVALFILTSCLSSDTSDVNDRRDQSADDGDLPAYDLFDGGVVGNVTAADQPSDVKDFISATVAAPALDYELCSRPTFYDVVYGNVCPAGSYDNGIEDGLNETDVNGIARRIVCSQRSQMDSVNGSSRPTVRIFNSSELLAQLGTRVNSSTVGRCSVVLFYAPWCVFCARLAPHYNALARAFPTLDVVAIDAFHFSSLNSRFGTIAVPNIMVFHNAKAVARFNNTDRTLANIAAFITNVTGITPDPTVVVTADDEIGPLSSTVTPENDYLLILSWVFVLVCATVACVRSSTGRRVWNTLVAIGNHDEGRHHLHLD